MPAGEHERAKHARSVRQVDGAGGEEVSAGKRIGEKTKLD